MSATRCVIIRRVVTKILLTPVIVPATASTEQILEVAKNRNINLSFGPRCAHEAQDTSDSVKEVSEAFLASYADALDLTGDFTCTVSAKKA